jgi:anti-sigma factor RsiW
MMNASLPLMTATFSLGRQGAYTLALWLAQGLVYAMISDDDRDELLEYAALCVRQMRRPT